MMKNSLLLSQLVDTFELWRSGNASQKQRIPDQLRQQAVELLSTYPPSKITTALRISGTQLKQWRRLFEVTKPVNFIALPALEETTTLLKLPGLLINPVDIQVSFANGHAITLNGIADICLLESLIMAVKS